MSEINNFFKLLNISDKSNYKNRDIYNLVSLKFELYAIIDSILALLFINIAIVVFHNIVLLFIIVFSDILFLSNLNNICKKIKNLKKHIKYYKRKLNVRIKI